jgi:hypothetical protein
LRCGKKIRKKKKKKKKKDRNKYSTNSATLIMHCYSRIQHAGFKEFE